MASKLTTDKLYCILYCPNKEMILEDVKQGEFPANVVSEVVTIIDPTTAGYLIKKAREFFTGTSEQV